MEKPTVDLNKEVEAWLSAYESFKKYVTATENLYIMFASRWCGPRRGLPEAFAAFRKALVEGEYKHLEVDGGLPDRKLDVE